MGSILRPTKIADFFYHLCDAITDVIFFMCIDAIPVILLSSKCGQFLYLRYFRLHMCIFVCICVLYQVLMRW